MTVDHVWQQVEQLLATATDRVVLVAPFIKKEVFQAALDAVPTKVGEITCVTRWSVPEVAAGVSDPEIAELAQRDGRATVRLCHNLHAKLYVADDRCLVGSANLTGKATGRVPAANIELLIETGKAHPEVERVLAAIEATAVPGTVELAEQIREQASLLQSDEDSPRVVVPGQDEQPARWLPETRNPDRLYRVYNGRHRHIGSDVLAGVIRDLTYLDIGPGLDEQAFGSAILGRLHAMPELQGLTAAGRMNLAEMQAELLAAGDLSAEQAQRAVETIAAWLRYFDDVHFVPIGPWEIRQGKELT
ncbi:phospholipase D family protein [Actinacidiphila guanduensis]|uniref:Phospholipase D Active site motif-containing protein n=1 Tax=Actinacidiphila guanduensis TaxID=310781 RepID=A0A1G9Y7C0_9ACTN|nr:phospholipase D family protein [Actinacidiphila guanduensis]SDN04947.1 Phospholipase D Active site motif-containing protein [Actinacidiphila guanduensis]